MRKAKRKYTRRVKKVILPATAVLHVVVPPRVVPVVAVHRDVVEIVPVPAPAPASKVKEPVSWWDSIFGTEKYSR
jgi:hypothetical protein